MCRPENLRLTREEFDELVENSHPVMACETLWAQAEVAADYRIDAENRLGTREYSPSSPPEPR